MVAEARHVQGLVMVVVGHDLAWEREMVRGEFLGAGIFEGGMWFYGFIYREEGHTGIRVI